MHIAIVAPCSSGPLADLLPGSGGANLGWGAYFMATLVRALIQRGHYVSVITLSPELVESRVLQGPKLSYYVHPTRLYKRMRDIYREERAAIADSISRARPDLLHAHWTYEFALPCLETGLPTLVTSHDNAFETLRYKTDLYRLGRLWLQIRIIRATPFLTAVSPNIARAHGRLTRTNIEVIPNPIELPPGREGEGGEKPGLVRIATVLNGWGNLKNPKAAIRAFQLVRRTFPDAELFMYGENFEEGGLAAQWSEREHLGRNVHFRGHLPPQALHKELKGTSLLLHPSRTEACPMTLLEAMALGLPIVAGENSGGVPWVLDYGRAGFLTAITDPEQIAAAVLRCLRNGDERRQKQLQALRRVSQLFSPDSVAARYEETYRRVLASSC